MYMITYTFSSFLKGENFGSFEWNKMKKAELNFKKKLFKGNKGVQNKTQWRPW